MSTPEIHDSSARLPMKAPSGPEERGLSWAMQRQVALVLGAALVLGGAFFADYVPDGAVPAHLVERHIALGAAMMIGGFLFLAVYLLTGILAAQSGARSGDEG